MPLIPNAEYETLARNAVVLDLGDIQRAGEQLIRSAHEESSRIISEARREREQIIKGAEELGRSEGYEAGHTEGLEAGHAEGRAAALQEWSARLEELVSAWLTALVSFEGERDEILSQARHDVLELALAIARHITKRVVRVDPGVIEAQLRETLSLVLDPTRLVIEVHPDDITRAEDVLPSLLDRLARATHAELAPRSDIEPGSVILHTANGRIDAAIDTQLRRIAESLLPDRSDHAPNGAETSGDPGTHFFPRNHTSDEAA